MDLAPDLNSKEPSCGTGMTCTGRRASGVLLFRGFTLTRIDKEPDPLAEKPLFSFRQTLRERHSR